MAEKTGRLINELPDATALDGSEYIPLYQNNRTVKGTPLQVQTLIQGSGCQIKCAELHLTREQFININTTPQLFIAAPGANKAILPIDCYFRMIYDTATYTSGGTLDVYIDADGSGGLNTYRIFQGADTATYTAANTVFGRVAQFDISGGENIIINRGVYVTTSGSDPTTGDSEISLFMTYRILDLSDVPS